MKKNELNDIFCYDEEKVNRVQDNLEQLDIVGVSQVLKAMADENRTKIIYSLSEEEELCVCDIANILEITVANASHHLRTLYNQNIVNYRKEGKLSFYYLQGEKIKEMMKVVLNHKEGVGAYV